MSSVSAISLGGMNAAMNRLNGSAQRIAATAAVSPVASSTAQGAASSASTAPPTPSLESDMVEQLAASHAFVANLQVFRREQAMLGSLLDVTA